MVHQDREGRAQDQVRVVQVDPQYGRRRRRRAGVAHHQYRSGRAADHDRPEGRALQVGTGGHVDVGEVDIVEERVVRLGGQELARDDRATRPELVVRRWPHDEVWRVGRQRRRDEPIENEQVHVGARCLGRSPRAGCLGSQRHVRTQLERLLQEQVALGHQQHPDLPGRAGDGHRAVVSQQVPTWNKGHPHVARPGRDGKRQVLAATPLYEGALSICELAVCEHLGRNVLRFLPEVLDVGGGRLARYPRDDAERGDGCVLVADPDPLVLDGEREGGGFGQRFGYPVRDDDEPRTRGFCAGGRHRQLKGILQVRLSIRRLQRVEGLE